MQKTNKKKLEEFIRVDHAGERGAIKIYEGQLLALNTIYKDNQLKETIEEMREHEREHCDYFENEIKKREIKPTKFLPLWDLLGVGLGFGTTLLGKKAAMLCTASVKKSKAFDWLLHNIEFVDTNGAQIDGDTVLGRDHDQDHDGETEEDEGEDA